MPVGDLSAELLSRGVHIRSFHQGIAATLSPTLGVRAAAAEEAFSVEVAFRLESTGIYSANHRTGVCQLAVGRGSGSTIGKALAAALINAQDAAHARHPPTR